MSHDAHNPTGGGAPPPRDPREMLDDFVDGMLVGGELAAFERALAASPDLRAAVQAQRSIDASLTRLFDRAAPVTLPSEDVSATPTVTPPSLRFVGNENQPTRAPEAPARRGGLSKPISRWWAAAAILVFALLAGLYVTGVIDVEQWRAGPSLIAAEAVYKRKVETGYLPDWVCVNDEQFVTNTKSMFDEPLLVRNTDDVKVVGWSYYEPVLSKNTAILLTKVCGTEVIVVMDRKENDRRLRVPASSGLHDYTKVIGNAVLHEISPLAEPRILPLVELKP